MSIRNRFYSLSIRTQLLAIIMIMALTVVVIIGYTWLEENWEVEELAHVTMRLVADHLVSEQQSLATSTGQLLCALSQLSEVRTHSAEEMDRILAEIAGRNDKYATLFIADRFGNVWSSSDPKARHRAVAGTRYFDSAMATGRLAAGEYEAGTPSGRHLLNFAVPYLNDQGEPAGVLCATVNLDYFNRLFQQAQLPHDSSYTIIDRQGIVLMHGLDADQTVGQPDIPVLFRQMRAGGEKGFLQTGSGPDSSGRILFFHKFTLEGETAPYLYVRAELPTSAVHAEPLAHLTVKLGFVFLIMAGALGGAWHVARKSIIERVEEVTSAVNRLADGDLHIGAARVVTGGELGELSAAFYEMARKLATREDALQEQAAFQEALLQSIPLPIFSTDIHGRYLVCNEAFAGFLGKHRHDVIDRSAAELFPESVAALFSARDQELLQHTGTQSFELSLEDLAGRCRQLLFVKGTFRRADGLPGGIVGAIMDLTGHREAEENLKVLTEKLRDLSSHMEADREQERLAISREIHDEIGQSLTALKLDLSWVRQRFLPDNQDFDGHLRGMLQLLDRLIASVQHIAAELRPPLLDNLGLAAAIEWQAGEFQRRTGVSCRLMLDEGLEVVSRETSTAIMRILQEALTNITRHARATAVEVSLRWAPAGDAILLEVADNGLGITPAQCGSPRAYGLMGMQERARLCHGELAITGNAGAGTTVRLSIPVTTVEESNEANTHR